MPEAVDKLLDPARLAALYETKLLGSPTEESFDRVTRLAAKLLNVPVALVSLVDADHQFFKSCLGMGEPWSIDRRTPLTHSFCQHVVTSEAMLAVKDARIDPLVKDNLAIRDLGVIAYLGVPLTTAAGHTLGSLCAIDSQPREWTDEQKSMLADLAAFVATEIDLQKNTLVASATLDALQAIRVETALETRVKCLADSMPQIVWSANADGNIQYYNQRWFDYTGLTFDQTKDWGWKAVIHPDDLERCIQLWTTAMRTGQPHVGEYRLKRGGDGVFRWHLSRSLPCRDEAGKIIEWVGTSTDIHDSKVAEESIKKSRDELEQRVEQRTEELRRGHSFIEAVLRNVSDGVIACDHAGQVTYVNPALKKMFDLDEMPEGNLSSEWASKHLPLYHAGTHELLHWRQRPMARAMRGEVVEDFEILIKNKSCGEVNVVVSARAMRDAEGEIVGAVAALHDITPLRRTQEELQTARQNADAANQAKSDFLANMSHEIRTPIAAIVGFSELQLRQDQSSADRDEYIHIVRRNAKHLLDLINDVLDLSKIEAGQMGIELVDCDLPRLLAEILSTMRPRAAEKALKFGITFTGPIPRIVQSDSLRLRQILINLLGNAIKFTEKGSVEIDVRFVVAGELGMLHIDVKDSGIGLTPPQMNKLFQSFMQADESTTRRFGGTGLGLTISRRLAHLLGGDISVKSAAGIGSIFSLSISCGEIADLELLEGLHETGLSPRVDLPAENIISFTGKILLAEDGRDNQRFFTTVLRAAGADVTVVENGLLALEKVAAQPFDLILMDMQMPIMDGYAAAAELMRRGCATPIIALTAHAMAEDREKCIASGCSDYISKPVDIGAFMQRIAQHLNRDLKQIEVTKTTRIETIRSTRRNYPQLLDVIDEYIQRLPGEVAKLEQLMSDYDLQLLRRVVHQLKGSGGTYGFDLITDVAAKVETTMDATEDLASIAEKVNELIAVIRRVEHFDEKRVDILTQEKA